MAEHAIPQAVQALGETQQFPQGSVDQQAWTHDITTNLATQIAREETVQQTALMQGDVEIAQTDLRCKMASEAHIRWTDRCKNGPHNSSFLCGGDETIDKDKILMIMESTQRPILSVLCECCTEAVHRIARHCQDLPENQRPGLWEEIE